MVVRLGRQFGDAGLGVQAMLLRRVQPGSMLYKQWSWEREQRLPSLDLTVWLGVVRTDWWGVAKP